MINTLEIKKIKNGEDISEISQLWENLSTFAFTQPDYYKNILNKKKEFLEPYIIVLYEEGVVTSIFIGQIIKTNFIFKLGYKSLFRLNHKSLEILYSGIIGKQDASAIKLFTKKLKETLNESNIDNIVIKYLDINSDAYRNIRHFTRLNLRNIIRIISPHYFLKVPDSFNSFLESRSKSVKYNIKRYTNRLQKEYGKRIEIILFQHIQEIDRLIKDIYSIGRQTYQFGIGVAISDSEDSRKSLQYELNTGRLRAWIMYLDNEPIAFWVGIIYKQTFLSYSTGYLQNYSHLRPGMYLNMEIIKYLCNSKEVKLFDFGFGYADYKKNYSNILINEEAHFTIYSNKPKGILLFALQNISNIINVSVKKILHKFDVLNFIKKTWRRKITKADQK